MGSKKKLIPWEQRTTTAYGKTMTNGEKQKIDNYNTNNKNEGQTKDNNWVLERKAIAQKSGTTDYKNIIRRHISQIGSILGVRGK